MTRTYVDSGVLIAGSRVTGPVGDAARALLDDPRRVFVSSAFVRLEVLPKARWLRRTYEIAFYETFFAEVTAWADPLDQVIEEAEREAARYGLAAVDALHVAAALLLGVDELVTTESPRKPIHRVAALQVVAL